MLDSPWYTYTKYLAEYDIEPALVCSVGDDDKDGEEEKGEHRLPDLHLVLGQAGWNVFNISLAIMNWIIWNIFLALWII